MAQYFKVIAMPNIMMHPPASGNMTHTVNGRKYVGVPGTPQSVPDFDAVMLEANGWTNAGTTGSTAQRPTTGLYAGFEYNDSTVGAKIKWDGKVWRHATTGSTV